MDNEFRLVGGAEVKQINLMKDTIGEIIWKRRVMKQMTLKDLSEKIGLTPMIISKLECNKLTYYPIDEIIKILEVLK